MKSILYLLLFITGIMGCKDESLNPNIVKGDYFPLEIGNSWYYESDELRNGSYISEIKSKVLLNDKEYYLMVNTRNYSTRETKDSTYLRKDERGYVYSRTLNGVEKNLYRLGANVNESWDFPMFDDDDRLDDKDIGKMTFMGYSTVKLGNTSLDSCKLFYFDAPNWADEENSNTLGSGIGVVSSGSSWMQFKLKSAKIGGRSYQF